MDIKFAMTQKKIGLLLVGGQHHILHLIPIVVGLQKNPNFKTTIYVRFEKEKKVCKDILKRLGVETVDVVILKTNKLAHALSPKRVFVISNLKVLKSLDAIVVAERTSTIIRKFSKKLPPFIHIPHGAGDGEKSYDPRIRLFDHVLVAGAKDKKRMVDLDLVTSASCHVTGYIKPFAVQLMNKPLPQLFDTSNPTVLYNPHFNLKLSSWEKFGLPLLRAFSEETDMNFIFAPHLKLFQKSNENIRAEIQTFDRFKNIHIDLGSENSADMTYTRTADIYLGDVSSQVYEFLSEPKPCVFIDNAHIEWKGNPDYAHWSYGPVCSSVPDVMTALKKGKESLPHYVKAQAEGCLAAKGDPAWDPIERAADILATILDAA